MQKREYKTLRDYSDEKVLNKRGEQGWELVAAVAGGLEYAADTYGGHPKQRAENVFI